MTKKKLTEDEQAAYRKKQQERLEEQQARISEILATNQDIHAIQKILSVNKFRPEAYTAIPKQELSERQTALDQERINARIKSVKTGELIEAGDKSSGLTDSVLVTKASKSDNQAPKNYNTWIKKTGLMTRIEPDPEPSDGPMKLVQVINPDSEGRGEIACEYIGTNLFNEIMDGNSPKVRLHIDGGQVTLLSKFINDAKGDEFQTIEDIDKQRKDNIPVVDILKKDYISKAKGFAKLFVANVLFGDNDVHGGNIGFRTDQKDGSLHWARIDNGKALSYNVRKKFGRPGITSYEKTPRTVNDFKQTILSTETYPEELFQGLALANDLAQEMTQLNTDNLAHIIKKSMENLKAAYGDNYLEDLEISKSLRQRMGFSENELLTEAILENKIMGNITRLKGELKEMAREEFKALFPKNPDEAAEAYADSIIGGELNNDAFLANLKAANIDITNSEDFDPTHAKEKMSPSLIEDLTRSIATTATPDQALIFSIKIKDEYYTQTLLKKVANLNAQDHLRNSALTLAIENGSIITAKNLLERGATASDQDLLISAFEKGMTDSKDKKSVQELIEKIIIKEGDQKSLDQALLLAIKLNLNDFSQNLIERGADSNAKDQDDNTALMLASKHLMPEIVKNLLENGAQVNAINKTGQSALSLVVESKFISSTSWDNVNEENAILDLLCEQPNLDVSARNNANLPLIYYMAQGTRFNNLGSLIAAGADIDLVGPDEKHPFTFKTPFSDYNLSDYTKKAIDDGNIEAVDRFIDLNKRLFKDNPLRNKEILIDDQSLLKYALNHKPEIAFNMIQNGAAINKKELKDNSVAKEILETKNFFHKLYKPFNKDDLVKIAILTPANNPSHSIKSSPLKLAIDTKQFELAEKMIESGYTFKKSELEPGVNIRSGSRIKRMFGIASKTKLKEFSEKKLKSCKIAAQDTASSANKSRSGSSSTTSLTPETTPPSSRSNSIER